MPKDRLLITISDVNGSYHFNIPELAKKIAIYSSWIILFIIVAGSSTIVYQRMSQIVATQKINTLTIEADNLKQNNESLALQIDEKAVELSQINTKIDEIEHLANIDRDTTAKIDQSNYLLRLKSAELTLAEKQAMLLLIPNGQPMKEYRRFSSNFGYRIHPITGKRHLHAGIDYAANVGSKIFATADGIVEFARSNHNKGYGNMLKIQHGFGFVTLYAHMQKLSVKRGQYVRKGDLIGLSGNSGLSTGPHLHYEVRFIGRALNPKFFVDWNIQNYDNIFDKEESVPWGYLQEASKRISHSSKIQ